MCAVNTQYARTFCTMDGRQATTKKKNVPKQSNTLWLAWVWIWIVLCYTFSLTTHCISIVLNCSDVKVDVAYGLKATRDATKINLSNNYLQIDNHFPHSILLVNFVFFLFLSSNSWRNWKWIEYTKR